MSGRGRGRGGRGRRGCGRNTGWTGRGHSTTTSKQKGLCAELGDYVFDYGQKGAADQMRNTWTRIVHHVGTIHGHDISNKLLNRTKTVIVAPAYPAAAVALQATNENNRAVRHNRI